EALPGRAMTATERTHKRRRKHGREAKAEEFSAFAAHAWATGTRDGNQKARSELWSLVGIGELGNGRNLPLCSHAAPRSARCSNDAAPLSRSVGSQDRVVARVRRGGHVRPRLAVFGQGYHSCHCRGRRCGRCRGNHQIVPLFRARTALGSAVAALIDNGASQPQKICPGQAEPGRSGAVRTSADAIAAALAPTGRTPTVLRNSGRPLVGARDAVAAARHPAHRAPLAGLSRRQLLCEGERRQPHGGDDQCLQYLAAKYAALAPISAADSATVNRTDFIKLPSRWLHAQRALCATNARACAI